jgi:hypothetical protein
MDSLNSLSNFLHLPVTTKEFRKKWNPTKTNVCTFTMKPNIKYPLVYTDFVKVKVKNELLPLYVSKENRYYILKEVPFRGIKPLVGNISCYDTQMENILKNLNLFGSSEIRYLRSL